MKTNRLILLTLLAATACAFGQNVPEHTCRILFLNRPADAPKTLHLFDGVSSQEVELPRMNLSPIYKLRSGPLNLRLLPAPVADPKTVSPDAPSATIPETCTDFYLLVTTDHGNKVTPVRMVAVNANAEQLARGQMLWFNLSDKAVAGTVGSEKILLKPNSREVLKEPRSGQGDYLVDLYFRVKDDETVHPLCETKWSHDPRSRSLVFVFPEGTRRAPRVSAFSDYRQEPEN